ncbi:hypothetical protein BJ912DRAFT_1090842 [Pholiota molesta]|nr:hypothetical protein BJ912DRAFT_1090842 [Pholiota molesta]
MPPIKCKFFDENGNILSKRHLDTKCPLSTRTIRIGSVRVPSNLAELSRTQRHGHLMCLLSHPPTPPVWLQQEGYGERVPRTILEGNPMPSQKRVPTHLRMPLLAGHPEQRITRLPVALLWLQRRVAILGRRLGKGRRESAWQRAWGSGGGSWGGANDTGTSAEKAKTTDSGGRGTQSGSANLDRPSTSGSLGDKGKGRAVDRQKDKEDIAMRDPSPPSRPPPSTSTAPIPPPIRDDRTKKPKRVDLPLLNPAVRSARERTPSFSPAPLTAIATKPLPRPVMPSLSKATSPNQRLMHRKVMKMEGGYEGRAALFSEVVSHLQEAVVFEIVYLRAQAEAMRWKKTQSSEIYAHTTRKARTIMDDRRAHFQSKISGAKLARDRALQRLGSLPELPTRTDQLAAIKVEKETIRAYTEELKEWLEELERHRSLLKAKQEAEEAQANSSHPPRLFQVFPRNRNFKRSNPFFSAKKNQRFVPRIEANGKNIDELVNRTTGLVHKIDSLKEEIEEVKKQREKMDKIYAQAEKQFSECDSNKETEAAKIRELTEQLQSLSLHKRPAAKNTLSPVKIDDLLEYIRPIVVERVTADLTKIVQSLAMRCRENQDRMADEIDEMLKPVLASTEQFAKLFILVSNVPQPASHCLGYHPLSELLIHIVP